MTIEESDISEKNDLITMLLALFFNSLGLHRFYAGRYVSGAILALIGSTSHVLRICDLFNVSIFNTIPIVIGLRVIAFIWALIDIYAIYSESFADGKGKLIVGKATKHENGIFQGPPVADIVLIIVMFILYLDIEWVIIPPITNYIA